MPGKTLKQKYPWSEIADGSGFFIPTLQPKTVRQEGLVQAMHANVDARAYVRIYKRRLGVMFHRRRSTAK